MRALKLLLAAAAVGVIVIAFRDVERGVWLLPESVDSDGSDDAEPILGYDGMDVDTLLEWMAEADLDREQLTRMLAYETAHHGRQVVISAIEDSL